MGAHVMAPAYLRDHLLPHFQLSGWSMDWYGGFPMYRFYMVVPALAIVALDVIFPYGVAFKLVAILGLVTLPFCCWAFGRLARFRYPMPELFAFAGDCLPARRELLDLRRQREDHDGGRVLVLDRPVAGDPRPRPARPRAARPASTAVWAAIVLALACCRHGIVLIFVVRRRGRCCGSCGSTRHRFVYGVTTVLAAAVLLSRVLGRAVPGQPRST